MEYMGDDINSKNVIRRILTRGKIRPHYQTQRVIRNVPMPSWVMGLLLSLLPMGWTPAAALAEPLQMRVAQQTPEQPTLEQSAPMTTDPTEVISSPQRVSRPTLRLGSEGSAVSELQAMLKLMGYFDDAVDGIYQDSTQSAVAQFQQAAGLSTDGIVGPATWNRLFPDPPAAANPPATTTASNASEPAALPPSTSSDNAASADPAAAFPPEASAQSTPIPEETPPAAGNPSQDDPSNTDATGNNQTTAPTDFPILRRGMHGPAIVRLQERLKSLDFYQGSLDGIFGPDTEAAVQQAQRHYQLSPDGVVGPATWSVLLR